MPLTATNLFMNWSGVSIVYGSTPTTINLLEIKSVQLQKQNDKQEWVSDAGDYPTLIITKNRRRRLVIASGDAAKCLAIPDNTACTITATLNDARNNASTGAIAIVLSNAVMVDEGTQGETNKFGMGTVTFEAYSTNGSTDPLSVTITP